MYVYIIGYFNIYNQQKPKESFGQKVQNVSQTLGAIKGMSAACEKFSTPVTGGNVSFYNQSVINEKE